MIPIALAFAVGLRAQAPDSSALRFESGDVCQLPAQKDSDPIDGFRRIKHELVNRLCWEILWDSDGRAPIRIPSLGSALLAVYESPKFLFYCSHDLGRCTQYSIQENQLGQGLKDILCGNGSSACRAGQENTDSLRAFVQQTEPALPFPARWIPVIDPPWNVHILGIDDNSVPTGTAAAFWTMSVDVGNKREIIEFFRKLRPPELENLENWFRSETLPSAGYRSITIPCFAISDPEIYVYGDRVSGVPIIIDVHWEPESERWREAGMSDGPLPPTPEMLRLIEETRRRIESVKCAKVNFP